MRTYGTQNGHDFQNANDDLVELFVAELGVMHSVEKRLTHALPLVARAAHAKALKNLIEIHLGETKGHVRTIEAIADSLNRKLPRKPCPTAEALIKRCVAVMLKMRKSGSLDVALAATAQKIEHYEIASYGTLCSWAEQLGLSHEYALLKSVLGQEKLADELLTGVVQHTAPLGKLIQRASLKRVKSAVRPPTLSHRSTLRGRRRMTGNDRQ